MVSIIVVELGLSSKEIVTSMPLEMGAMFPPKRNNLRDRRLQPSYESRAIVAVFIMSTLLMKVKSVPDKIIVGTIASDSFDL